MIAVIAADPGVPAAIVWHGGPPAGAQPHGERASERFRQRALDPPGELLDRLGERGRADPNGSTPIMPVCRRLATSRRSRWAGRHGLTGSIAGPRATAVECLKRETDALTALAELARKEAGHRKSLPAQQLDEPGDRGRLARPGPTLEQQPRRLGRSGHSQRSYLPISSAVVSTCPAIARSSSRPPARKPTSTSASRACSRK